MTPYTWSKEQLHDVSHVLRNVQAQGLCPNMQSSSICSNTHPLAFRIECMNQTVGDSLISV